MSAATIVRVVIGAWGAVLSTFLVVRQVGHDRRTIKVRCMVAFVALGFDEQRMQEAISVTVVNEGRRPVEVLGVGFRRAAGGIAYPKRLGPSVLPALLGDGQSAAIYFDKAELDEWDREADSPLAYAVVFDATRNEYRADYPQPDPDWTPPGASDPAAST